jgi:2-polyprenyl-3-methyl-5-hydroxy-6-metoxy-1,4-benzoquinol methylase
MQNIVESYGWASSEGPQSCGYILPEIFSIVKQLKIRSIIDVGAGNGKLCFELLREGFRVAGVEYDRKGFEIAKFNCPSVNFYNYGVQDDPALILSHEDKFDAVVSTEVVEHLFSPHLLPVYAGALMTEGGFLIISTPYHGYLKNLAISILNKWDRHHTTLWHGGHIKFWSKATLTQLLRENGFKVIKFKGVGRFPFFWKSMIVVSQKI